MRRRLGAGVVVLLVVVLWTGALVVRDGREALAPPPEAEAAVVLGAAVDGPDPSPVFAARLDHAVDLYRSGRVRRLFLTGGAAPGTEAESVVGRRYVVAKGVNPDHVVIEDRSRTTWQNVVCLRDTLGRTPDVLVVSDPYHLRRAVGMARDLGFEATASATPTSRYRSVRTKAPFLAREVYFTGVDAVARVLGRRGGCPD